MNKRKVLLATVGAAALWSSFGRAQAAEVLYQGVGFLQGTETLADSFSLPTAGTLTVTLTNIAFPQQLASLSLLVSTPGGALGQASACAPTCSNMYNVSAGNVVTQWFGTAQGAQNTGAYAMEIQFQPTTGGNPVPLPTSIALLLSGLGLLIWQRRARGGAPQSIGEAQVA